MKIEGTVLLHQGCIFPYFSEAFKNKEDFDGVVFASIILQALLLKISQLRKDSKMGVFRTSIFVGTWASIKDWNVGI